MSRELATINRESPITVNLKDLSYDGYEVNDIYPLFQELEFRSLLDRIQGEKPLEVQSELAEFDYEIIDHISEGFFTGIEALHLEMIKIGRASCRERVNN